MGYDSKVAIKAEPLAAEYLINTWNAYLKESCENDMVSMGNPLPDKTIEDGNFTIFIWNWTKWYEDDPLFPEVTCTMNALENLNDHTETEEGWGYYYIRLGENLEDYPDYKSNDRGSAAIEFYVTRDFELPDTSKKTSDLLNAAVRILRKANKCDNAAVAEMLGCNAEELEACLYSLIPTGKPVGLYNNPE